MHNIKLRKLSWIGSAREDLKTFPKPVQREIDFSLHQIQEGKTPQNVKHLTGIAPGVLEILSNHNKNTFRAVYAIKLGEDIYVLHTFQKKSKTGTETPKQEIDLIRKRILPQKKMQKKEENAMNKEKIIRSSGNIYKDLDFANAEKMQAKATLVSQILTIIENKK